MDGDIKMWAKYNRPMKIYYDVKDQNKNSIPKYTSAPIEYKNLFVSFTFDS